MSSAYARSQAGTWSVVPTPDRGTDAGLNATAAISATDAWAVGNGIIDHSNASAWRPVAGASIKAGVTWQLEAVAVIPNADPAQLLAVGWTGQYAAPENTANSHALIERWNGSQWVRLKAATNASKGVELDGITALSGQDAWAVGINGVIEHWNGVNWSRVRSAGNYHGLDGCENLDAVSAVSQKDVYAVGYDTGILPWRRQ